MVRGIGTLIPVGLAAAYVAAAVAIQLLRGPQSGRPRQDPGVAKPHQSFFAPAWLITFITFALGPVERLFVLLRFSPNALTFGSLCMAALSAVALALGHFAAGGWLYLLAGILDLFDGRIARATGRVTASGAFYDSVIDRYAEGLIFGGLAIYYRHDFVLYVVLGCMVGSYMVSYTRARGESLGVRTVVGTMQRPERIVALGAGLAFSPAVGLLLEPGAQHPLHHLAIVALGFVALSAMGTALQRFAHVWVLLRRQDAASVSPAPREPGSPEASVRAAQTPDRLGA